MQIKIEDAMKTKLADVDNAIIHLQETLFSMAQQAMKDMSPFAVATIMQEHNKTFYMLRRLDRLLNG